MAEVYDPNTNTTPPFFGHAGVSLALVLASKEHSSQKNVSICSCEKIVCLFFSSSLDIGAAYGTAKAGSGISSIGVWKPSIFMKSLIPVVMAGILGIYGMIVSVILI